jgi:hypothetical protein
MDLSFLANVDFWSAVFGLVTFVVLVIAFADAAKNYRRD